MEFSFHQRIVTILVAAVCCLNLSFAQSERLNAYIDCNCDRNYLRQELNYVNHVRDQALADVQLFIYNIRNGSGGQSYDLDFIGAKTFKDLNKKLAYETTPNMTNDEVRSGLAKKVAQGLLHYLLASDMADQIEFSVPDQEVVGQVDIATEDPWNNWIFEIYGQGELDKESSREQFNVEFGFESDRVTDKWRIRADLELNHSESQYKGSDQDFVSILQRHYAQGSVVRSLNNHWSAGAFSGIQKSTYNNLNMSFYFRPAVEFNIFPYREVLRREITIAYKVGYVRNDYIEETIYEKMQEQLFNHSLDVQMRFRQPWGDVLTYLEASSYLHDFSKNRVELYSRVSVRVFKGLAVRFSANLDLIRDQLNLPVGDASIEDILLRQRQIATDFEVSTGVGLSYTFGSAFNNVVNTRL